MQKFRSIVSTLPHKIMWLNRGRSTSGQYYILFPEIRKHNKEFKEYLRMTTGTFDYVLSNVEGLLKKRWCNLHRQPILPEERLVITLRFLATGQSYKCLSFAFRMGLSTVSSIIVECMDSIWTSLQPKHMPIPTRRDFLEISELFWKKCKFPHCLGAIDGRHIRIKKPSHSGTLYYNYKRFFSMVLQAHVDAKYRYVTIDICRYGSQSDGRIFKYSKLKKVIDSKHLQIPGESLLPSTNIIAPYFFVADGAYPLMETLMKPFRGDKLTKEETFFNKRISRARVVAENTFAKTCQKWRIFYTTIEQSPNVVEKIIKTTCILHNIILDLESDNDGDIVPIVEDMLQNIDEDNNMNNLTQFKQGEQVRRKLIRYLMEESTMKLR